MLLDAFRGQRGRARRGHGSVLAPRNWRVASRLILLVAIPAVLGLTLAGLRMTNAMSSARAYAKVSQNAALGQQVTGLAQALENERTGAAMFVADGRPASGLAALDQRYASTDAWATRVRRLAAQLDRAQPPARTQGQRGLGPGQHRGAARTAAGHRAGPGLPAGRDQPLHHGDHRLVPGR